MKSEKIVKKEKKFKDLVEVLKIFSPGAAIRSAVDDILRAGMGALIVLENDKVYDIFEGGFKINCKFTSQKLVELAKMDGAIIVSSDIKKILYANTVLFPDTRIQTRETGTRHRAAERTAKYAKTLVIAVSERKNKITLYYDDLHYEIEAASEILRRATETLQILEKQREIFNEAISNLNLLEIKNSVLVYDVCYALQRGEIVKRISVSVKKYLVELGKEGTIVSVRLKELTKDLNSERKFLIEDYFSKPIKIENALAKMTFDSLLELSYLAKELFGFNVDEKLCSRGIRILSKTNLSEDNKQNISSNFKTLNDLIKATDEKLIEVLKDEGVVRLFKKELDSLEDKIIKGKNL